MIVFRCKLLSFGGRILPMSTIPKRKLSSRKIGVQARLELTIGRQFGYRTETCILVYNCCNFVSASTMTHQSRATIVVAEQALIKYTAL